MQLRELTLLLTDEEHDSLVRVLERDGVDVSKPQLVGTAVAQIVLEWVELKERV